MQTICSKLPSVWSSTGRYHESSREWRFPLLILSKVQTKWAEFLVHFMDANVPEGGNQREILTRASIAMPKSDLNMTQTDFDDN